MGKRMYSEEFKREALRKFGESGATLSQVAREIGIKQQTLHRWKIQAEGAAGVVAGSGAAENNRELERLRRENIRLKAERDILKKALGYFAKEPT
jgi:transposase